MAAVVRRFAALSIAMIACGRVDFDARDGGSIDANLGPRIVDAALGNAHTCVMASTGQLKCWGQNDWGILGIGSSIAGAYPMPSAIPELSLGSEPVVDLVTLADYSCARVGSGNLKCWGNNDGFQLGYGDFNSRGDEPNEMGDSLPHVALSAGPPIDDVVTGHYHTCVVRDGGVACWGNNDVDQLGYAGARTSAMQLANLANVNLGTGVSVKAIATMFNATCILDAMERVKCWGANFSGELGLGDTQTRGDSLADMGDNLPFVDLGAPARSIAAGYGHVCAITDIGLKCFGASSVGALGGGDTEIRGDEPSDMGASLPVVDLGGPVEQVACGDDFSCAILTGGVVKCWGGNEHGSLGLGDTADRGDQPNEMGANLPARSLPAPAARVFAGGKHACALLVTGELACWGYNREGQLGDGTTQDLGDQAGESPIIHSVASVFPR